MNHLVVIENLILIHCYVKIIQKIDTFGTLWALARKALRIIILNCGLKNSKCECSSNCRHLLRLPILCFNHRSPTEQRFIRSVIIHTALAEPRISYAI